MIYIFFSFGRGFRGFFAMLFPKAPGSCCKKSFELIFDTLYFYIYEYEDINIFVLSGVVSFLAGIFY